MLYPRYFFKGFFDCFINFNFSCLVLLYFPFVMTVHLELLFFFTLPPFSLCVVAAPFAACNSLELNYLLTPRLGQDALQTVNIPLPLSITCFTLTATVLFIHASVPADAWPLCTLCAHISSLLPYVSLHCWCTLSAPFTCVLPCPLCLPQWYKYWTMFCLVL